MTDKYEALREAAEKVPPGYNYVMDKEEILELLDELAALKVDAYRYQWLRRTFIADDESWPDDVAEAKTGEQLDVAIDAAREGK
ncbi:hypothetical protein [Robbsia andropogonis]|uniref:hypothetical protein n=1 Tax=Robbsia andropogonis TaxID=28092 RepID=UPI002A6B53AA|nr:hypothetical protein [Robbsia andropogonis]